MNRNITTDRGFLCTILQSFPHVFSSTDVRRLTNYSQARVWQKLTGLVYAGYVEKVNHARGENGAQLYRVVREKVRGIA